LLLFVFFVAVVFAVSFFFIGRLWERKIDPGGGNAVVSEEVHNIYMTFGTLPTLYASLDMLTKTDPCYVFFSREDTFDVSKMPQNVTLINQPGSYGNSQVAQMALATVQNIEANNTNPKYHFFVDDLRALLPYYCFMKVGISTDRYAITLLSDGTGTYTGFDQNYLGDQGDDNWNTHKQELDTIFDKYQNQNLSGSDYDLMLYSTQYMYPISQMSNVEYWMQFAEYGHIKTGVSQQITAQLMRAALVKKQPYNILSVLTIEKQEIFFDATINNPTFAIEGESLRDFLDNLFLDSPKPIMIISGTNPNPAGFTDDGGTVDKIIQEFGDQYKLVWEPHPAYKDDDNKMAQKGITVLPAQLPMEALLWAYPDASVGGFASSLYMAARTHQVRFFIGALYSPLTVLDDNGFFANATIRF